MGTSTILKWHLLPKFLVLNFLIFNYLSLSAGDNDLSDKGKFHIDQQSMCESVGGMVFFDHDKDGCHYPGQEGYVSGVDVYLFYCGESDPSHANAIASDITDSHGAFVFGSDEVGDANICLSADTSYYVLFDLKNNPEGTFDHYCFTQGDGTNCYNSESRDDVVDWTSGTTDCYNPAGDDNDDDIVAGIVLCDNVIDLALIKTIATPGPYELDDLVEFVITVVNQGIHSATDINVVDYVPAGFSFNASNNSGWDGTNAPTYNYTIGGPLLPGDSEEISIFLTVEYLEDQSDENYTNIAEIGSAKDSDGNPATDIDSTPDSDPYNDGDPIDDSLDDKDDEDDHDPALLPLTGRLTPACMVGCDVACIGQLNLSLGASCEATIVPSMLMPGLAGACDDVANAAYFEIVLTDHYGASIVGNTIGAEHVGQLITYSIKVLNTDIGPCENSCWGNILVESKVAPVLDCSLPTQTISCIELTTFDGPPLSGSGTIGCFATEVTIEILNEQILEVDKCESDLVKKVIRQYQAVDLAGNRSNICTQELNIVKLDPAFIKFPASGNQELQCNEDFLVIDTSNLSQDVVPYYCPVTGSGTPGVMIGTPIPLYPLPQSACNVFVEYTDEVILDQPCKKQVLRTWNVRQWHCEEEYNGTSVQLVTLVDTQAPVLDCPSDTIHVSTSGNNCTAKVRLPEIGAVDSCQGAIAHIDMTYPGGFVENQNGGEVSGIPVGLHPVTYTAYDACHNTSSCHVYVNVIDERPPVIICERHTVVSIPTTGEAHVPADRFDDGSYDDCGQVILKVRRMDLSCQKSESDSTSIEFGDYAVFCCEDVGATHMVVLRAYEHTGTDADTLGRYNECMVEVTVDDKNPPSLVAPPDITVSCDFVFDGDDLSIFGVIADSEFDRGPIVLQADSVNIEGTGYDGLSIGSCGLPIVETVNMGDVNSCGIGKITRTFTATKNGSEVSDVQMITVVSPIEFDPDRIVWPRDTVLFNTCNISSLDPDGGNLLPGYDRPSIGDSICELIGISITDEKIFEPVIGRDACFKVFRTWSVIDWCNTDINTGLPARWDSVQVLGVENNLAPVIRCSNTAEVYNSFDANCNPVMVNLTARADDECTPDQELYWTWSIDLGSDGSIDTTGTGNEVSASYIPGQHQIVWYAEDLCGNVSNPCAQNFEITNDKAAPAICLDHIVTDLVLMDLDWDGAVETEMVEIWATDVIKPDSHPCGHELSYSFDQAGLQDSIIYGCDDIGFNSVRVYVTNLVNGAQSFCWTEIEVQDNNAIDVCGGLIHNPTSDGDLSGFIITDNGSHVAQTEVKLLGSEIPNAITDLNGMYAFDNMPIGGNYTVLPEKNIEHINGVSTLDLVLIQKHILGLEILDSPYKMIAADINRSNTISAADLIQLRRLILGEIDAYDNNTSWRFVDEEHEFSNNSDPWTTVIPEHYDIEGLSGDMAIDFVGVKIGDVSGNAKGDELVKAEVRTSKQALTFHASTHTEGMAMVVSFRSADFKEVNGYQLTLEFNESNYELLKIDGEALDITKEHVGTRYAERGIATMSWHTEEAMSIGSDEVLFKAYFRPKADGIQNIEILSSSAITTQEAYVLGETTDKVKIEMVKEALTSTMELSQNEPNPWRESTVIGFTIPEGGEVQVRLYDNTGKLIRNITDTYSSGKNEIEVGRDFISTPGIYLYDIQYKDQIQHKRMIVLD